MRKKELGETWFLDYAVIPRKHDVFELKFFFHGIDGKWFGVKPSWCMASTSWLSQIHSLFFKMRHRKEMPQVVSIPFQVPANASKIHRILGKPMKYALVDFQGVPLFRQSGWRWCPVRTGWSRNGYEDCENREICWASPGFALACSPGQDNEIMHAIVRELQTRVIRIVGVFQLPLANELSNVNQSASKGSKYWIFDYRWTLRVFLSIDVWHISFKI